MSIENAILKLAEAIEKHANVLEKINAPVVSGSENPVDFSELGKVPVLTSENNEEKKTRKPRKQLEEKIKEENLINKSEDVKLEEVKTENLITVESVKDKAKALIAKGADRMAIKALISKLGAESIVDLTPEALAELDKKLNEM